MTLSFSNTDSTLTNSAASLLSSSISSSLIITRVTITNTDTVSHGVTLYRVQSGGSAATSNIIIGPNNYPGLIAAGESLALPLTGHNFVSGQSLYGMADTSGFVNISISYVAENS
jgi:hypothetical protein